MKKILYFYLIKISFSQLGRIQIETCPSYICGEMEKTEEGRCLKNLNETAIKVSDLSCEENTECLEYKPGSGYCVDKVEKDLIGLYPGERCDNELVDRKCAFGPKKCDEEFKRCLGYGMGHKCRLTADCNPEFFCDQYRCMPTIPLRGNCDSDESCGHLAFCYRNPPIAQFGICVPYMGLKVGEQASFHFNNNKWSRYNPFLLCESFYADSNGICRDTFLSVSKGTQCNSDEDCYTSQNENYFCKCTMNDIGDKVCDAGPSDEEWEQAKLDFIDYLSKTQYCHPARGLGECQQREAYRKWKCSEFKAINYAALFNMSSCLQNHPEGNTIYGQYKYWCFSYIIGILGIFLIGVLF